MISLSHWGMFELSMETAISIAQGVIDGKFALWLCDDTGWLIPDDPSLPSQDGKSL